MSVPGPRLEATAVSGVSALLQVRGLTRSFSLGGGFLRPARTLNAVNGIDLDVRQGETLGIVGESGCGKSTLARMLLGLLPPSSGSVQLNGQDLSKIDRKALARRVQPIFQDPYSSLNPRRTIASIVMLPLEVHGIGTKDARRKLALEMLERVGLPARFANSTPKQLSGGQRQRVAIARALVMRPEIVVCDEPTSALDVSVQAQILNLLADLRQEFKLTYIFISHNLAVVEHVATRVAVMYLGRIVELAENKALFARPGHPYTRALLASVLTPEPGLGVPDPGLGLEFPDPLNPPSGCAFHPRCTQRMVDCSKAVPQLLAYRSDRILNNLNQPAKQELDRRKDQSAVNHPDNLAACFLHRHPPVSQALSEPT
jgi:peptide/nickel transport system ATP-binding protein